MTAPTTFPLEVRAARRPFPPYALVLNGSTVIRHCWGVTRWHALGRAARWAADRQPGQARITVGRWLS